MSEFVAHEVQVSATAGREGHQAYELVQGYSPVHNSVLRRLAHAVIHLLVHQTEDDCLVAHQGLVVALGVGYGLLVSTLVGELPPYSSHTPVLVPELLYPLDPVVGNTHSHPEVEAHAIGGERSRQSGHSADILRNRDCIRIEFVDEHIRQREVSNRILVNSVVEVEGIVAEVLAQTVVPVYHACHAVETEAVQMVLLHPVFAVGKQEVFDLVLAVIEAAGAPGGMVTLMALVEIQVVPAVEAAQAFGLIDHRMGMDYVHNDRNSAGVGIIHEALEVLRRAEAGTQGKEV